MVERVRIKISEQIDNEMKARIKRFVKTAIIQKYFTLKVFCEDFRTYLEKKISGQTLLTEYCQISSTEEI